MNLKLKYYREEGEEDCYPLQYFTEEERVYSIILLEMKRDIGGEMWCDKYQDFVDDCCGSKCEYYKPCNGKNGSCRKLKNGFIETGKKIMLKNGIAIPMDKNDKIANDKNT